MNLLLRPASWFSSARHQGPIITQHRPPAVPKESDDDELVVVFAVHKRSST